MQGRAFAISPGLYTMVAVEKTEVRNLRTFCQTFSEMLNNFKGCRLFRKGDFIWEESHSL